ncbi:AEC family transporter [Pseudothauera rhizosphaerae]|uniref:AEC family transporter n=1 Tax=Pseudothauera rhizosphaerae TaxID=2565932 RepID=A0A4S4AS84_9RHOO|nr:AEC family transporter [Pseudothauera rhizosphaerae]THF61360.1 AEC family transporter [Pseudothauera rhizosphaerae]
MQSLLLLLPDFSLILLGAVLRRGLLDADGVWAGLEKLVYFVLFPALLFNALASAPLDAGRMLPLFLAGLGVLFSGFVLGWVGQPLMGLSSIAFASRLQCAYRFNTYIGIAIAGKLHGALGVATMGALSGTMVPFANILAVGMLARHGQGRLLGELARNPLVLATLAGLAFNLSGLELAEPLQAVLRRLGDAAVALGLLAVGAALRWGKVGGSLAGATWLLAVKLALMPAVGWGLGRALGVEGMAFDLLVLFAALPSASSAYILAMRMGGDGPGVAWLISASTLLAVFSLSAWLYLLG